MMTDEEAKILTRQLVEYHTLKAATDQDATRAMARTQLAQLFAASLVTLFADVISVRHKSVTTEPSLNDKQKRFHEKALSFGLNYWMDIATTAEKFSIDEVAALNIRVARQPHTGGLYARWYFSSRTQRDDFLARHP